MIIDTSALIAILLGEPEAELFASAIAVDPKRLISTFTALESGIVIEAKKGDTGGRELDLLIHQAKIEIVPLTAEQLTVLQSRTNISNEISFVNSVDSSMASRMSWR